MFSIDSLVIDIIFKAGAEPQPEQLIEALGGEEAVSKLTLFDPDMEDPRIEMQLSPSIPFRRRGERRILAIDGSVAPMRKNPQEDPVVPLDLRDHKARLLAIANAMDVRLCRMFALGGWGDAVLIAREARDLRGIALLSWVLDPTTDSSGRRRESRLSQQEFEDKIHAYEKRLEERSERQILADLGPATFTRDGDLLVLDVLESDGTWDTRKSIAVEIALAAVDKFSTIPGAPSSEPAPSPEPAPKPSPPVAQPAPEPVEVGPSLRAAELPDRPVLIFPAERWDLDIAAALGKGDYESVLRSSDELSAELRDRIMRDGAGFLAPLEFLSEVFVDGKPLSRPQFDSDAAQLEGGARAMQVHCPRFGPALLIVSETHGRFITSERDHGTAVLELVR